MIKKYEHYITRSIQSVYWRKMIAPFLYLILLAALWLCLPFSDLLFPQQVSDYAQIGANYKTGNQYVQMELSDLYFTGYTNTQLGQTVGYYYYAMCPSYPLKEDESASPPAQTADSADNTCIFVLLTPKTSEEGLPHIAHVTLKTRILHKGNGYQQMTEALATDLSWTAQGLQGKVSPYLLSEADFFSPLNIFLLTVFFAGGIYAIAEIIIAFTYILFPILSPPCRKLDRFGKPQELLAQAEEELATLPQLATEDMFITEHYFIEIAHSGIAIVPIAEMLWIYKHSTLHKIFWYHFNISYTLHITANKHLYIQCPKNMKSDIDGIIDYLAEANHKILVGFNEENRRKVQEIQQPAEGGSKITRFLRHKP